MKIERFLRESKKAQLEGFKLGAFQFRNFEGLEELSLTLTIVNPWWKGNGSEVEIKFKFYK